MPQPEWDATMTRLRGEFDEMPCMRLTADMAGTLFGLPHTTVEVLLERLAAEGFLSRTEQGEYVRRTTAP